MEMIITIILYLVMLVFGILQIILFFKVWNMTNDVSAPAFRLIQYGDALNVILSIIIKVTGRLYAKNVDVTYTKGERDFPTCLQILNKLIEVKNVC